MGVACPTLMLACPELPCLRSRSVNLPGKCKVMLPFQVPPVNMMVVGGSWVLLLASVTGKAAP